MTTTKSISLAIPSYNRPASLLRRMREAREFPEIREVVVCDNSDVTDQQVEAEVAVNPKVVYRKNPANIGGGANFLRLIETTTCDYAWWRGDDDPLTSAQVDALSAAIEGSEKPGLFILSHQASHAYMGQGVADFCAHFADVQPMGWLTMIVLPTKLAQKSLRWGYWGIGTGWANVCLVLGLFREDPELNFQVVPFTMQVGEFRETGRAEGLQWAFFKTCLEQFPRTAELVACPRERAVYLSGWRSTQTLRLCTTMIRLKLGLMRAERIGFRTVAPLIALREPRACLVAVALLLVYWTPSVWWRLVVAIRVGYWSKDRLRALGLEWLDGKNLVARVRELKARTESTRASGFL